MSSTPQGLTHIMRAFSGDLALYTRANLYRRGVSTKPGKLHGGGPRLAAFEI